MSKTLSDYLQSVANVNSLPWRGRVIEANGQSVVSRGPTARIGEVCEIRCANRISIEAQFVGFREDCAFIMTIDDGVGVRKGDEIVAFGHMPEIRVGPELLGRVVNACGEPLDRKGPLRLGGLIETHRSCPDPFDRVPIDHILATGIRVIDGMLAIGRGQRVGIFGGSGVGKSTLLGMMTRNAEVDIVVIGLIGERGREVIEFVNEALGKEGLARSVVIVETSDRAPLLKMRAAFNATSIAEYFASQGMQVLLIVDSITRFAMAAREVGLAAGEPPTNKGYTPSVFSKMARLFERAGRFGHGGSITAFYTVLMEGDDEQDPIVDAVRSFLDGHIMLSRDLAAEGWYPPVDVLRSVSRLASVVADSTHQADALEARLQMAVYSRFEDLIRIGAYKRGTDPTLDEALDARSELRKFLTQPAHVTSQIAETLKGLHRLNSRAPS